MTTSLSLPIWAIDGAHSSIGFTVRHMVVSKVRGRFTRWSGTIAMDERDPAKAQVEITIEPASVDTGVEQRDNHLRSPDFFDVERYPTMTFRSTRSEKVGEREYRLIGDLTMHGVTRPVSLEVEFAGSAKDPWGGVRAGFSARGSLDRKDFGLTYNQLLETGGVVVGEKVDLDIEVEAVKQAAPVPEPAAAAA
jgi:polyisoprenoid-binding protein YceI